MLAVFLTSGMPCLRSSTLSQSHLQATVLRAPAQPSSFAAIHSNTSRCRHSTQQITRLRTNSYSDASLATSESPAKPPGELSTDQDSGPVSSADQELTVLVDVLPDRVQSLLGQRSPPSQVQIQCPASVTIAHLSNTCTLLVLQGQLVEVVLDLGRPVLARYTHGDEMLSSAPLTSAELFEVVAKVGEFGGDNRAGINRSLHRISCMRNRDGQIVGLTCRVGRAVPGSASMAADVVLSGNSILLLGRPGIGKTTAIRDICHMLSTAAQKRVVIVDTSNEIAGDGDVPHMAIGSARRMQVPVPEQQHRTMIEAVENHMPEVVVIDEIGSEAEAHAAATIAQRGVQLVATAHGQTLDNILNNPTLQGLVGGIESVTLGDESAKKRKVQKTVRERAGPPTFDCCIEMLDRHEWRIIEDVATATDRLLAGKGVSSKLRTQEADGTISTHSGLGPSASLASQDSSQASEAIALSDSTETDEWAPAVDAADDSESEEAALSHLQRLQELSRTWKSTQDRGPSRSAPSGDSIADSDEWEVDGIAQMQVYLHGIEQPALQAALKGTPLWNRIALRHNLEGCDAVLTLRGKTRTGSWLRTAAKSAGVPIFSIKTSSPDHLERAVRTILGLEPSPGGVFPSPGGLAQASLITDDEEEETPDTADSATSLAINTPGYQDAVDEARIAAEQIVIPRQQPIELLPRTQQLLDIQINVVNSFQLKYELIGSEASSRLRILPS